MMFATKFQVYYKLSPKVAKIQLHS